MNYLSLHLPPWCDAVIYFGIVFASENSFHSFSAQHPPVWCFLTFHRLSSPNRLSFYPVNCIVVGKYQDRRYVDDVLYSIRRKRLMSNKLDPFNDIIACRVPNIVAYHPCSRELYTRAIKYKKDKHIYKRRTT